MYRVFPTDTDETHSDHHRATASSWLRKSRPYRCCAVLRLAAASFAFAVAFAAMGCPSGKGNEAAARDGAPSSAPETMRGSGAGGGDSAAAPDLKKRRAEFEKNLAASHKQRAEMEESSRKEVEEEERKAREEMAAIEKLPAAERDARMKELEARKKKEEWNVDGLVLKLDSLEGTRNSIKGVVVNRRRETVSQATITFDLFDSDKAHIGVASATIDDLKPKTKWYFEVDTLGREVAGFKPKALTAF